MEVSNTNNDNKTNIVNILGPLSSQVLAGEKMSHKTWRNVLKKLKRKLKRRKAATKQEGNASCNGDASEDDAFAEHIREKEMQLQYVEHARWLQREKAAQEEWLKMKWLAEQEKKRQEEQDRRIREEWEEQERKEKEEREKEELKEKKKKEKQEALLSEAMANEKTTKGPQPSHNPLAPPGYGKEAEVCSFFMKTGACRFGEWCSRSHPEPEICHTLMFPGMYLHMSLDKGQNDFDTDLTLEFEEGEIYEDFKQFYEDVLPEFKCIGQVNQFKVSCNFEPHLRGNVYVQYKTEEEAMKAYSKFNGRWYGGKQLSCKVVDIKRWAAAICGLYSENRCHKGKSCNFLHVFRNPTREFNRADRDFESQNYRQHWRDYSGKRYNNNSSRYDRSYHNDRSRRLHSPSSSRFRSKRSPSHNRRRRRRSSSSSPNNSSQVRNSKKSRHRSRSRSRSRSRIQSRPRARSWSRARSKSRSRSRSPSSSKASSVRSNRHSHSSQSAKRDKRGKTKVKGQSKNSRSHNSSRSTSRSSNKLSSKSRRKSSSSSPSSTSSSSFASSSS